MDRSSRCLAARSCPDLSAAPFEERKIDQRAFRVGERIKYQVHYGGLAGGVSTQEVLGSESISGRSAYHIVFEANTNKTFDVFHKVRERHDSWIDADGLFTLKYQEGVEQGSYRKKSETLVDPLTGQDFVSAKAIKNMHIQAGEVSFDLVLGYPAKSLWASFEQQLQHVVAQVAGVRSVSVKASSQVVAHAAQPGVALLPQVKTQ